MQAVILAAGEGKRVRPLTWSRPKAMIPVANRPIIAYTIDALVKNGIRDIIVVVGYRKEQVTRFLNQLDLPIEVVVQEKQLGTAHALRQAESRIEGDFLLLPGDNYIDAQSVAKIKEIKNAILVKEHPSPSNFGVVTIRDGQVDSIVEKPDHAPSFLVRTRDIFVKQRLLPVREGKRYHRCHLLHDRSRYQDQRRHCRRLAGRDLPLGSAQTQPAPP